MAVFPDLETKLWTQYDLATTSGDVTFTESEVHQVLDGGINFQIRFAPLLANKPQKSHSKEKENRDVFAPPYIPNLFVAEADGYVVLLNKFAVQPRHFLLVTKEFQKQSAPPTPEDLLTTYLILSRLEAKEPHLAFFNCGEQSGAR